MTEIEKMFKNAGIKKQYCGWLDMGDLDCQMQYVRCNSITEWKHAVFSSRFGESEEEPEHIYPPFTAEKQLAIEKVILTKRYRKISYYIIDEDYSATLDCDTTNRDIVPYVTWSKTRDETLADIINYLWQDLTDQEKEEIRRILNENS